MIVLSRNRKMRKILKSISKLKGRRSFWNTCLINTKEKDGRVILSIFLHSFSLKCVGIYPVRYSCINYLTYILLTILLCLALINSYKESWQNLFLKRCCHDIWHKVKSSETSESNKRFNISITSNTKSIHIVITSNFLT